MNGIGSMTIQKIYDVVVVVFVVVLLLSFFLDVYQ